MNTKQTPEEKAKEYYKISDLNLEAKVGTDTFQRYLGFVDGYKSLSTEIEDLKRWKAEQIAVTQPIFDYMQNHKEMPLGESMTEKIVEFAKERDSMAERNRLLEELLWLGQMIIHDCNKYQGANLVNGEIEKFNKHIEQLLSNQNNKK